MPITITFSEPLTSSQITYLTRIAQVSDTGDHCTFLIETSIADGYRDLAVFTVHHCLSAQLETETDPNVEYFGIGADLLQSSHALDTILRLIPDLVPVDCEIVIAELQERVSG